VGGTSLENPKIRKKKSEKSENPSEKLLSQENDDGRFILVSVPMYSIDVSKYETVSTYQCTIVSPIHINMYCHVYV
jgi:hypothetical protein